MASTQGGEYAERLRALEGARWKRWLHVQAPYRWNVRRLCRGRVLEVGCGIGRNLVALPDAVGVDHNSEAVAIARTRGCRAWSTPEWRNCPDAVAHSYDTLLIAHVLEHLTSAEADELLDAYRPYLKSGGRLVLICPQEAGFRTDATHVRFLDDTDLAHLIEVRGAVVSRASFPLPRAAGKVFPYNEFVVVGAL